MQCHGVAYDSQRKALSIQLYMHKLTDAHIWLVTLVTDRGERICHTFWEHGQFCSLGRPTKHQDLNSLHERADTFRLCHLVHLNDFIYSLSLLPHHHTCSESSIRRISDGPWIMVSIKWLTGSAVKHKQALQTGTLFSKWGHTKLINLYIYMDTQYRKLINEWMSKNCIFTKNFNTHQPC